MSLPTSHRMLLPLTLALLALTTGCGGGSSDGTCKPYTCEGFGYNCGEIDDGCGGKLSCGTCADAFTCGGGDTPRANVCGCSARKQCSPEAQCGTEPDGCGGTITCGTCAAPETCGGRGEAHTCGIPAAERQCEGDNWCWEYPLPHGHAIQGAHFRAPDDGWAVGEAGYIQHWNGTKWTPVPTDTRNLLYGVHAVSASDVWAVGAGGLVLRGAGGGFSPVASGTTQELHSVWASGANDVWTVGAGGTVLRNTGGGFQALTTDTTQTLNSVWGSGPGDVWVVGNAGTVRHHDGNTLASINSNTNLPLYEVTGSGPNDVWAVSSDDPCLLCDDYGIVYRVSTDGLSESLHTNEELFHVFSAGPSMLLAAGEEGLRYRWNGTAWQPLDKGQDGVLAGSGPTDAWLFGSYFYGEVDRWDGAKWSAQTPGRKPKDLVGVSGTSANDLWTVSTVGELMHWTGNGWRVPVGYTENILLQATGVYAASPTTVWFITSSLSTDSRHIYRSDGKTFTQELPSNEHPLLAVHGSSESDVWVVGEAGDALHREGTNWVHTSTGVTVALRGVWAQSASLAWAVGDAGTVLRWDGAVWTQQTSNTTMALRGVWGSGPADVWAVGGGGTLLHFNGTAWSTVTSGTTANLNAVGGASASAVWAVGDSGTVLRFDGSKWTAERTGLSRSLRAVWAASASDVWLVGDSAILHKP